MIKNDFNRITSNIEKSLKGELFEFVRSVINENGSINYISGIFDSINNSSIENKKEWNSKILLFIYNLNKKVFDEVYGYFNYEYDNCIDETLKFSTDEEYIKKRESKYLDTRIGIDEKISIGLEVEANNKYPVRIDFYDQEGYEKYQCGTDATVPDGNEFLVPIVHDGKDITKLCAFFETIQNLGYYRNNVANNIAGQINLGIDYLDSKEAVRNFFEIYCNVEELLFYISNKEGDLIRQNIYSSSRFKPISELIGERILDEDMSREDLLRMLYVDRYGSATNNLGMYYKKNTVCIRDLEDRNRARLEFRIPNGSVEADTWIDNIRLYGKIMEVSKYLADLKDKEYLSDKDEKLLKIKEDLKDSLSLEDKLSMLMDLLFEDNKIKQIYFSRFKKTLEMIKSSGTSNYVNLNDMEPSFGEVDLVDQYYSDSPKHMVVEYDPDTGEYIENGRRRRL